MDGKSESQDDVGEEEWEEIEETVNQSEISLLETLEQINERKIYFFSFQGKAL